MLFSEGVMVHPNQSVPEAPKHLVCQGTHFFVGVWVVACHDVINEILYGQGWIQDFRKGGN